MSVQKQTRLKVADNSGALEVMCFHIIGSTGKKRAFLGDRIVCAVKKARPGAEVKKGDVVYAMVVRTVNPQRRSNGTYIRFSDNAVVLLKDPAKNDPRFTAIDGPIPIEVRDALMVVDKDNMDIISMANEVL